MSFISFIQTRPFPFLKMIWGNHLESLQQNWNKYQLFIIVIYSPGTLKQPFFNGWKSWVLPMILFSCHDGFIYKSPRLCASGCRTLTDFFRVKHAVKFTCSAAKQSGWSTFTRRSFAMKKNRRSIYVNNLILKVLEQNPVKFHFWIFFDALQLVDFNNHLTKRVCVRVSTIFSLKRWKYNISWHMCILADDLHHFNATI